MIPSNDGTWDGAVGRAMEDWRAANEEATQALIHTHADGKEVGKKGEGPTRTYFTGASA